MRARTVSWEPLVLIGKTKRWAVRVQRNVDGTRWNWHVIKRETERKYAGTKLSRSFAAAKGFAATRARARCSAPSAPFASSTSKASRGSDEDYDRYS
jgi:hypothetical protein